MSDVVVGVAVAEVVEAGVDCCHVVVVDEVGADCCHVVVVG